MSLITHLSNAFTDTTIAKLYREPLFNNGSLYAFDFLDAYCNPHPVGNLSKDLVFKNLIAGRGDAVSRISSAQNGGFINNTGSGLTVNFLNAAISFGLTHVLNTSNNAFLVIIWFKADATGANNSVVLTHGSNAFANQQFMIVSNNVGNTVTTTVGSYGPSVTCTTNAVRQVALSWEAGTLKTYINGALVATNTIAATTLPVPVASLDEGIGHYGFNVTDYNSIGTGYNAFKGTYYRAYKENLTVSAAESGLTVSQQALAQVQADYAANSTRFT